MSMYNSQTFTPEEVEKGLHIEFLQFLLYCNTRSDRGCYNEIHMWSDGYCTVVEWSQSEYCRNHFEFIDENHVVKVQVVYPDGTAALVDTDEEAAQCRYQWAQEHK